MKLNMSKATEAKVTNMLTSSQNVLRLVYDSEGCGCAVSGVPTLYEANAKDVGSEQRADCPLPVYYWPPHQVFFGDEALTLKANETNNTFTLRNDSEILNARLTVKQPSASK
ncbi:iron-sulfur cluster biosynthesis family protein [Aureibacillus halotolerans]|uniref:Uncharacterized protein YqkB n=1 Tax=Aureibacillus halotolerans TaxID=1508390 RepID=A0A4R6U772_9BACI|nr:iron-sulfur cluster biosynthesis family protein [Aureibacillus halotolerans]TDQ41616.1 uncharacterized protein YqkB [Aureibacillus halotolerans]